MLIKVCQSLRSRLEKSRDYSGVPDISDTEISEVEASADTVEEFVFTPPQLQEGGSLSPSAPRSNVMSILRAGRGPGRVVTFDIPEVM